MLLSVPLFGLICVVLMPSMYFVCSCFCLLFLLFVSVFLYMHKDITHKKKTNETLNYNKCTQDIQNEKNNQHIPNARNKLWINPMHMWKKHNLCRQWTDTTIRNNNINTHNNTNNNTQKNSHIRLLSAKYWGMCCHFVAMFYCCVCNLYRCVSMMIASRACMLLDFLSSDHFIR